MNGGRHTHYRRRRTAGGKHLNKGYQLTNGSVKAAGRSCTADHAPRSRLLTWRVSRRRVDFPRSPNGLKHSVSAGEHLIHPGVRVTLRISRGQSPGDVMSDEWAGSSALPGVVGRRALSVTSKAAGRAVRSFPRSFHQEPRPEPGWTRNVYSKRGLPF